MADDDCDNDEDGHDTVTRRLAYLLTMVTSTLIWAILGSACRYPDWAPYSHGLLNPVGPLRTLVETLIEPSKRP